MKYLLPLGLLSLGFYVGSLVGLSLNTPLIERNPADGLKMACVRSDEGLVCGRVSKLINTAVKAREKASE